ncbi:MAG: hypothetical protein QOD99_1868 [Chthoniobacter sp.]|jgi:hypothetical protein|nr:hypothetical protein [Chthoniobacter sp.]
MAKVNRRTPRRLAARATTRSSRATIRVPLWWVNSIVALFLLPIAAIWTRTFVSCLSLATFQHYLWASEEFWFFGLGAVLWTIAFFGLPKPLWIYVFGHELTHALWVWMMGGRVSTFRVASDGGHIISNRSNFWIALAPYFFPVYAIGVIAIYAVAGLFYDVGAYHRLLYALIGAAWAFHISFTLWMIPKGQTDLTYYGTFFSLVIIYLMNLLVLTALLIVASPHVTLGAFCRELLHNAESFSSWVWMAFTPPGKP